MVAENVHQNIPYFKVWKQTFIRQADIQRKFNTKRFMLIHVHSLSLRYIAHAFPLSTQGIANQRINQF
jgi:hypothetical protein